MLERRGVQQRLERRSRLPAAAARAVELRLAEIATAHHGEDVAGPRIDRDQRSLQIGIGEAAQPLRHRALRHLLQVRHERRPDFPFGRMVSAKLISKELTQVVLRVPGLRDFGARVRSNAKTRAPGRLLLLRRDESLVAHPPEHDVAARHGIVEMIPGRERSGGARKTGNQGGLGQGQLFRRSSEQMPRHRLDTVNARAQIDAIQVQLEDLILGELRIDHHGKHRLVELASIGLPVGQKQRPGELLRQRRTALLRAWLADVAEDGASERNGIDADVAVEPMVLDRDERVLQVGGNVSERHVLPVLVHPEPPLAVRCKEPRVTDSPGEPIDRVALSHDPHHADCGCNRQDHENGDRHTVANASGPEGHAGGAFAIARGARRSCNVSDRTM